MQEINANVRKWKICCVVKAKRNSRGRVLVKQEGTGHPNLKRNLV